MWYKLACLALISLSFSLFAATTDEDLRNDLVALKKQTQVLTAKIKKLQKQIAVKQKSKKPGKDVDNKVVRFKHRDGANQPYTRIPESKPTKVSFLQRKPNVAIQNSDLVKPKYDPAHENRDVQDHGPKFHSSIISVHLPNNSQEDPAYYPKGLIADGDVISYIAGTPVVRSPYTGQRPAFDGSDYLVNVSSINRDVRLMEQRRKLYQTYKDLGYPPPNRPIIALSGKLEPFGIVSNPFIGHTEGDISLGAAEMDMAAILNNMVEGFISVGFDEGPPVEGGPRFANSLLRLNLGFINIGDLDQSPIYFTAGQLFAPYGRYSSAMVSAPLTLRLARNKTRPVILGYKTQNEYGPFAAIYGFRSDTTLGKSGNGGVSGGYKFNIANINGEIGAAYVHSIADADGMQLTFFGAPQNFGGFGAPLRGNEAVRKTPGANGYGILRYGRYNFTAEWIGAVSRFRPQDLSMNYQGARPQAGQVELGATFMAFDKPASVGLGYQWTRDALALGLPKSRYSAVFNISLWKDTIESIEYRHELDYPLYSFANGASPANRVNVPIFASGSKADSLLLQVGVYF